MEYNSFLERARKIHGDKYEYPEFDNISVTKKIKIICPIHGEFEQVMYAHLKGQNCPKCVGLRRGYTTEDFIRDSRKKFGDKFDYSKTLYNNKREKVCIIYKEFISDSNPTGEFWQFPYNHLNSKDGLPSLCNRGRTYEKIENQEVKEKMKNKFIKKVKKFTGINMIIRELNIMELFKRFV